MTQFAVEVVAGDGPSASPSPSPSTSTSGTTGGTGLLDHGRHVDGPRQRQPRLASTGTGGASAFSSRRLRL
ncbi:hypothetical protein [Streptomyces pseudogriseolus]|uniref:hypothetical protein n=1 Tax=Streptomyces pseudogriseolus TaxID=36817 RepID=UPI00117FA2C8